MNQIVSSPTPLREQINFSETPFVNNDFSSFLGLFEGKAKERKAARAENSESPTGTSSNTLGTIGSIFAGLFGVAGGLAPILPSLGIGSKSRIKEAEAIALANAGVYDAQTEATLAAIEAKNKETEQLLIIGGAIFLVLIIFTVVMKR